MYKCTEKNFFVSETNASELVALSYLSLEEYLSSAVNVLTKTINILHVTKRDFFQLNYLPSDQ